MQPIAIAKSQWNDFLSRLGENDGSLFVTDGFSRQPRDETVLKMFLGHEQIDALLRSPQYTSTFVALELVPAALRKEQAREFLEEALGKSPSFHLRAERIQTVFEEMMMNCLVSAEGAAASEQLGKSLPLRICLALSWNREELWIHAFDSYGAFRRKNFARPFRPIGQGISSTHGHAGRGMRMMMDATTDMYIRSSDDFGTWIAVRIDLSMTANKNDELPKRLLVDFK